VVVVGSGISGLSAAWHLLDHADVTLLESGERLGGHTHTHQVEVDGQTGPVDTGFIVFNHRTYPGLTRWFNQLGVKVHEADMSFAVSVEDGRFEWCGSSLKSVFAQKRNLLSPTFWRMLIDILRFNAQAPKDSARWARTGEAGPSLGDYLDQHHYSERFQMGYLLPMAGAIWSCPALQMRAFPLQSFVRFCLNHGLLSLVNRPQWLSLKGGSQTYITALLEQTRHQGLALSVKTGHPVAGLDWVDAKTVRVRGRKAADGSDFELTADAVILACHSDQALEILGQVDHPAKDHLRKIRYQPNKAYLHTDLSFMPRRRGAWAAWNYQSSHLKAQPDQRIAVTYWMNQLQSLVFDRPLLVTLNPLTPPPATETLRVLDYAHPIFDGPAIQAQSDLSVAQGADRVWFAGAWLGNGFHEDGFQSGRQAAMDLVERLGCPSHSHGPTAGQLESLAAGSMA